LDGVLVSALLLLLLLLVVLVLVLVLLLPLLPAILCDCNSRCRSCGGQPPGPFLTLPCSSLQGQVKGQQHAGWAAERYK
jgi:hypothetical protein